MKKLSEMSITDLTPEQQTTFKEMAQRKLSKIQKGVQKDIGTMSDLPAGMSVPAEDTATMKDSQMTIAFAFGVVYGIVRTMPPLYWDIEGAELEYQATGVAFGVGGCGAAVTGSSLYSAQEIAAMGEIHIHIKVISAFVEINVWTADMYPIGVWYGVNPEPLAAGSFGSNCAVTAKS